MSDKHLSGEEKRRAMKEQFKKDLQERKEFLRKTKNLRQLQNINRALGEMTPQDDTDEWINKLNEESAFAEAKLEMAAESAKEREERKQTDEDMQKIIAENMVEEMKREMLEEAEFKANQPDNPYEEIENKAKSLLPTDDSEPTPPSNENEEEEDSGPPKRTFGDRDL